MVTTQFESDRAIQVDSDIDIDIDPGQFAVVSAHEKVLGKKSILITFHPSVSERQGLMSLW